MKTLFAAAGAALAGWFPAVATAQSGPMMIGGMRGDGWMWGYWRNVDAGHSARRGGRPLHVNGTYFGRYA